jgi:predicted protein tyrosine phosphatase
VKFIKLLFLCSRNKWRSLTAEKIFDGLNGYEVRSVRIPKSFSHPFRKVLVTNSGKS